MPLLADLVTALRRDTTARRRLAGGGVFIAFEGGEGAGKSTQVRRLQEWLTSEGRVVAGTREPGATPSGARHPRRSCSTARTPAIAPRAEALLYAADRAHHVHDVLRPALDAGAVVITDRYVDSSLAYQGAGRTLPLDDVRAVALGHRGAQARPGRAARPRRPGRPGRGPAAGRSPTGWRPSRWTSTSGSGRPSSTWPRPTPTATWSLDARQTRTRSPRRSASASPSCSPGCRCRPLAQAEAPAADEPPCRTSRRRRTVRAPHHPHAQTGATAAAAPVTTRSAEGVWSQVDRPAGRRRRAAGRRDRPGGDDPRLAVHRPARLRPLGRRPGLRRRAAVPRRRLRHVPRVPHGAGRHPRRRARRRPRGAVDRRRRMPAAGPRSPAARRPRAAGRSSLIEDADRLTETASNALLKAIEEPPPRTVFLLCAPSLHPDDISVTIRSRCRVVGAADAAGRRRRRRAGPPRRRRPGAGRLVGRRPRRATSAGPAGWPATRRPGWPARRCSPCRCRWCRWPPASTPPTTSSTRPRRRPTRPPAARDARRDRGAQDRLGVGRHAARASAAAAAGAPAQLKELEKRQKSPGHPHRPRRARPGAGRPRRLLPRRLVLAARRRATQLPLNHPDRRADADGTGPPDRRRRGRCAASTPSSPAAPRSSRT